MHKEQIITALKENHLAFTEAMRGLAGKAFTSAPAGKWTAGQHLAHIILSVKPLAQGLRFLPKIVVRLMFGKANRPSKTYEALVERYQITLKNGAKATGNFIPKPVDESQKEALIQKLNTLVEQLVRALEGYTEEELDKYIIPHPLLGKLTLREMMYFTAYHVTHHMKIVQGV